MENLCEVSQDVHESEEIDIESIKSKSHRLDQLNWLNH